MKRQKFGPCTVHACDRHGIVCGAKVQHREEWTVDPSDKARPVTCKTCLEILNARPSTDLLKRSRI